MVNIIDKRFTQKNETIENRQKFIKRYKKSIKNAVREAVNSDSIKDFKFKDKKIKIKVNGEDSMDIPSPHNDPENGNYDYIHVGNKQYQTGDTITKPPKDGGKQVKGGKDKGDDDGFEFELTEKEFADFFFEDLELPEMIKKRFTGDAYEIQRCGYSNSGGPSSLNIKQTIIRAFMRRFALNKKYEKDELDKKLRKKHLELASLCKGEDSRTTNDIINTTEDIKVTELEIVDIQKKIHFLEDVDMRYNYRDRVDLPSTKAVMFCLMDVSGSMGETEKDIAKRFFLLLNMFLQRNYDTVDVVFVRHAEWAEECDEQTFFYGKESGGTVVSTGYHKIREIIDSRYDSNNWNIYIAQATDGDNYDDDNMLVHDLLVNSLLPVAQYFAYIEIGKTWREASDLYSVFEILQERFKNLAVRVINDYPEIFEVFRSLFKKDKLQ